MRWRSLPVDPYFLAGLLSIVGLGGWFVVSARSSSAPRLERLPAEVVTELDTTVQPYRLGSAGRPVQVVEIFDYECEACAAAHRATKAVLARYIGRGTVSFAVYDVPLPSHGNAFPAAVVARCVHNGNPDAFWRYRDVVLSSRDEWTRAYPVEPVLLSLAARAGADTAAVARCIREDGSKEMARLRSARAVVGAAGLTFTPAWTVNGKLVRWDQLEAELERAASGR